MTKSLQLTFECDWDGCEYSDNNDETFYKHISTHISQLKVVPSENGGEMYECLWKNCHLNSNDSSVIVWHLKYHGYHSILKAKGVAVAASRKLPPCNYPENDNAAETWNKPSACEWDDCGSSGFAGYKEFITHVQAHVNGTGVPYKCCWTGCSFTSPKIKSKITDHVKVHTGERLIACAVCGNMFCSTTKFADHCIRQKTSIDDDSFKCGYCFTYLPSERIFRDHMRQHVHHHKCCFCDLTCHSPSVLVEHIRYRHLPYKPYKCSSCSHACKSAFDLKQHLRSHTKDVPYYYCNEKNCQFKCKRQTYLMKHYYEVHQDSLNEGGVFVCHLCDKKYSRGASLTKHLLLAHNIRKPPGYSRFIYQHEGDGCFHLRTVRLESLEVMETDEGGQNKRGNEETTLKSDVPETSVEGKNLNQTTTIIDVVNEKGEVISSDVYPQPTLDVDALPPDAKIVAVCVSDSKDDQAFSNELN